MLFIRLFFGVLLIGLFFISDAFAFRMSPFRMELEPDGINSTKLVNIDNNSDAKLAVQIRIESREIEQNGTEINSDAEDEFVIYPAQLVMDPNTNQSVRIQYIGDTNITAEKAYRLIAEQLPVDFNSKIPNKSDLKFLINFRGALFVTPREAEADLTLDRFVTNKNNSILLDFKNQGSRHASLKQLQLTLTDNSGKKTVIDNQTELNGIYGETILANHSRSFTLNCPKKLANQIKSIDFTYLKD